MAASATKSGAWLSTLPLTPLVCIQIMTPSVIDIGLSLCASVCLPHQCVHWMRWWCWAVGDTWIKLQVESGKAFSSCCHWWCYSSLMVLANIPSHLEPTVFFMIKCQDAWWHINCSKANCDVSVLGCHELRHLCCIKHWSGSHQSWCCSREVKKGDQWCFRPTIFAFHKKPFAAASMSLP